MKKIFITAVVLCFAFAASAQKLDDVSDKINKKNFAGAKADIDKLLADPKNQKNADAWYYKGRVYNGLSRDSSVSKDESLTLKTDAAAAFKKGQELDSKDLRMTLENHVSYLDLYLGMYDLGSRYFRDKNFDKSYEAFKDAGEMGSFIRSKKYTYTEYNIPAVDTALILNTGVAASQAKKEAEAMGYYRQLVDNDIHNPDFRDVYVSLADYYLRVNDNASYDAVRAKGMKYYPTDPYWNQAELDKVRKTGDKAALYKKYEEMIADDPANYTLNYNYAVELYNSIYGKDAPAVSLGQSELDTKAKAIDVLKKTIRLDKEIGATSLMGNLTYNIAADYSNAMTAAKDPKKKADYKKIMLTKVDESIPYNEAVVKFVKGQSVMHGADKANATIALDHLVEMYKLKGNAAKAAEYEKMRGDFR